MSQTIDFNQLANPAVLDLMPYQGGKPIEELERELGIKNIVKLASNENPKGPSAAVKEVIKQQLPHLSLYPDGNGFYLKQSIAKKLVVTADNITLGNGSNDVLDLIARTFLTETKEVIYSQYAFIVYALATQSMGASANVVPAQSNDSKTPYGHDLSAMLDAITEKTALIFIANPNNPTGTLLAPTEVYGFLKNVPSDVIVVLDEAYCEYLPKETEQQAIKWLDEFPNLIVTRTFSKAYGLAGLRVGYSISHPAISELMNRMRQPFNVNSLALAAAETAMSDDAYIAQSRDLNCEGLKQLEEGFKQLGLSFIPSKGNFIAVEIGENAGQIYQELLKEGVIVRPIAGYGMPHHLRVSVGLPEQNEIFLQALSKVLHRV